jgi:CBS domain-containing protein
MEKAILARDMMTRNLVTLSPEMHVFDAIDVLLRHRISGAPVVDASQRFLGIFSERSCLEFILDAAYEQLPDSELMAFVDSDPPTITEETDLLAIAQTFLDASCRRLPVLDADGRLRGQLSRRDVIAAVRSQVKRPERVPSGPGLYLSALYEAGAARPL